MGNRFKAALMVAGLTTVLLAGAGPLIALQIKGDRQSILLVAWAAVFGLWSFAVVGAVVVFCLRRVLRSISTVRRELAAKNNKDVIDEVRDARLKQSKHEFKQELLLDRIDAGTTTLLGDIDSFRADEVVPDLETTPWHGGLPGNPKVLFVTSNGSGMGHLSRCLAVAAEAERAGYRTAILTLSTASDIVRQSGYPVMYHPSATASPWSLSVWNRSFARFLQKRFELDRPDIVIFDGTAVYRGVTQVCRRFEIPLVWLRRGMWKKEITRVQYDRPFEVADFVVVPGEVTGQHIPDQPDAEYVGPVSQANQFEILSAYEAKRSLGLDTNRHYVLVQVGSAQMDGKPIVGMIVDSLRQAVGDLSPVVLVSPVAQSEPEVPGAIVVHGRYPLAPYLRAFDLAVTSAGYNSVHENISVGLPAVYVPNIDAVTDDQTARAELVEQAGMGLVARTRSELATAIHRLTEPKHLAAVKAALALNSPADGAGAIVEVLTDISERTRPAKLHPDGSGNDSETR